MGSTLDTVEVPHLTVRNSIDQYGKFILIFGPNSIEQYGRNVENSAEKAKNSMGNRTNSILKFRPEQYRTVWKQYGAGPNFQGSPAAFLVAPSFNRHN
jgi:hypothetical protein